jgi:type II secretion system protein C
MEYYGSILNPMARAQKTSRKVIALTPDARERILAAALEHPDLGVRRLVHVLKQEGIEASESAVRSMLLKDELHTRELRLRRLEDRHLREGLELSDGQKQALEKFNPCLRERHIESRRPGGLLVLDVVDLWDFPQIGPTVLHAAIDPSCCLAFAWIRKATDSVAAESLLTDQVLPFYRQHGIKPQAVLNGPGMVFDAGGQAEYRKFLETQRIAPWPPPEGAASQKNGFIESFERKVRTQFLVPASRSDDLQGIEALQQDFAAWLARYNAEAQLPGFPNMGRTPLAAFQALKPPEVPEEKPEPKAAAVEALPPAPAAALPAAPSLPKVEKRGEWTPGREKWIFRAVNTALLCLVVYFGWMIASKLLDAQRLEADSGRIASGQPMDNADIDPARAAVRPLDDYQVVWDRNLFGVSKPALDTSGREKMAVTKIAVAGKDVGLKLIGTVVASNPKLNYAVIDVNATREQGIFRERERVGKAVISRIFRNNVIIETDGGQRRRLTVGEEEVLKKPQAAQASLPSYPESPAPAAQSADVREGTINIQVPRDVIESSMSNIPALMEEVSISPHLRDGNPDGFTVRSVGRRNILSRLGLRAGDVIKSIDDTELAGPEEAEMFFRRLAEGGDISILVERHGRPRRLNLNIK